MAEINSQPAIVVFLDLEKAFELASPTATADVLVTKGISVLLMKWTPNYFNERSARVRFQWHASGYRNFKNGTQPRGVLSPTLFNTLMEALVGLLLHRQVSLISYPDDFALVTAG